MTENHKGEHCVSDHPHDLKRRTDIECPDCEGFLAKGTPFPESLVCLFCTKRWIMKDDKLELFHNQTDKW